MAEKMALVSDIALEELSDKVDDLREDITLLADGLEACRNENAVIEEQVAASKDDAATKMAQLLNRVIQLEQHQIALEGALNKMQNDLSVFLVELRDLKKCVARAFPREEFELFKFEFLAEQQELKQRVDLCLSGAVFVSFACSD